MSQEKAKELRKIGKKEAKKNPKTTARLHVRSPEKTARAQTDQQQTERLMAGGALAGFPSRFLRGETVTSTVASPRMAAAGHTKLEPGYPSTEPGYPSTEPGYPRLEAAGRAEEAPREDGGRLASEAEEVLNAETLMRRNEAAERKKKQSRKDRRERVWDARRLVMKQAREGRQTRTGPDAGVGVGGEATAQAGPSDFSSSLGGNGEDFGGFEAHTTGFG
eukprot:489154-Prorocentrum_minimum.AAC.1